jgi:hypothetical protein
MLDADIIQGFGYTYDLQDIDYNGQHTIDGASNVILENKRISELTNSPSKDEIIQEMNLHNADEVGIDNQWTYADAEYHLLLSDKYHVQTN